MYPIEIVSSFFAKPGVSSFSAVTLTGISAYVFPSLIIFNVPVAPADPFSAFNPSFEKLLYLLISESLESKTNLSFQSIIPIG